MNATSSLPSAPELAAKNAVRFPNESDAYRQARNALLAEEIELRRHIERVAEQRRSLPPGGAVTKDYHFDSEAGPVSFAQMFADKQTLVVYSYMFGPQRHRPCPMCTSLLSAWDGEALDVGQRVALAVVARSPIERLVAFREERRWRGLKLYSDPSGDYTRDYVSAADSDIPAFNVFTPSRRYGAPFLERRDGHGDGRPRTGSARRAGPDAALDHPRFDAGGTRDELVPRSWTTPTEPEGRVPSCDVGGGPGATPAFGRRTSGGEVRHLVSVTHRLVARLRLETSHHRRQDARKPP